MIKLCHQLFEKLKKKKKKLKYITVTSAMKRSLEEIPGNSTNKKPSNEAIGSLIPPNLLTILQPHQLEAVNFLLQRLLPDHTPSTTSNASVSERLMQTGAILADDMGTGKVSFFRKYSQSTLFSAF